VALLTVSLGDDGRLVDQVRQAGYGGLVIEAFGAGHVHVPVAYRLKELAALMPVVLASRTRSGDMLRHTYDFRGSESDLLSSGLISAGPLDGPKARVLLSLLLTTGANREQIAGTFAAWAGD
jgi:L-asparaginase